MGVGHAGVFALDANIANAQDKRRLESTSLSDLENKFYAYRDAQTQFRHGQKVTTVRS